jgi:lysophospholipase L1-like esterase
MAVEESVTALVAIVAALLAVCAAGELAARWWIRRRALYYVLPPGLRLLLYPDPDVFPELERQTRFEVNSDGERGGEVPRRDSGLYRVLVGGGSQPEGFLLNQQTAWPGALERLLAAPEHLQLLEADEVHVGSVARSGVGSEALDLIFDRLLPRYPRLQLIVIFIGATDVLRWLEHGAPRSMHPVRTADVFRCHPEGPFRLNVRQLAAVELALRARRRWLRPVEAHPRAGRWIAGARAMRARARAIITDVPDPSPMLDHFEFHFRHLLRKAKAHADRVLVVRQPWFDKEYSPEEAAQMWHGAQGQVWREEATTYYSFQVVSELMRLVDGKAAAIARSLDVEQLDLMPLLERSLRTYYDCFHVTPAGARAVAAAVADAVLEPLRHSAKPETRGHAEATPCRDLRAS